jgi:hypothetical protein
MRRFGADDMASTLRSLGLGPRAALLVEPLTPEAPAPAADGGGVRRLVRRGREAAWGAVGYVLGWNSGGVVVGGAEEERAEKSVGVHTLRDAGGGGGGGGGRGNDYWNGNSTVFSGDGDEGKDA